jgi:hypothetical protein
LKNLDFSGNLAAGQYRPNGVCGAPIPALIAGHVSTTLRGHLKRILFMNAQATSTPTPPQAGRRIVWINVMTVVSATILIGAEVFGAAFAGSWAFANLFGLDETIRRVLDVAFLALGAYIMFKFVRFAQKVEPFSR